MNYGFSKHNHVSLCIALSLFCLPKKVTNPECFREPNASARKASPPLAGQRGQRTFLLASATHYALDYLVINVTYEFIHL